MTAAAPLASSAALIGVIDPAWAPVANTMLIVFLALLHAREARRVRKASKEAHEAKVQARDAKRAVGAVQRDTTDRDTGHRRRWTDTR